MIYSVYNHDRKVFDYYEGMGPGGTHAGAPPSPLFGGGIGVAPEVAAWKVPPGARKVGSGELPRGRVASFGTVGGLGDILDSTSPVLLLVAGYLAWRYLR
jgi:hypothetical protein